RRRSIMRSYIIANTVTLESPQDDRPKWIQVAQAGEYQGYSGGALTFTKSVLQQMVDNFHRHPSYRPGAQFASPDELARGAYDVIPFDWRHASEQRPTTPESQAAYAWALDLQVRDGIGGPELWALTRYLEPMRSYVRQGRVKSTSIAVHPDAID